MDQSMDIAAVPSRLNEVGQLMAAFLSLRTLLIRLQRPVIMTMNA